MLVHRQPRRLVVIGRHLAIHTCYHPQTLARDGHVCKQCMLVGLDMLHRLSQLLLRHMVEVGHKRPRVFADVLLAPSAFEHSLAHYCRARRLDGLHLRLVALGESSTILLRLLTKIITTNGGSYRFP